jgi:hypothetical protein
MMRDSDIDITIGQMDALQEPIPLRREDGEVIELRRVPRWLERMNEQKQAKDLTGYITGPDDAA